MKYKQRFKDMPIDTSWTYEEDREWFIKELSDLAFGEDTIERGYSMEEVIEKLKEFSDGAYRVHYDCLTEEEKKLLEENQ